MAISKGIHTKTSKECVRYYYSYFKFTKGYKEWKQNRANSLDFELSPKIAPENTSNGIDASKTCCNTADADFDCIYHSIFEEDIDLALALSISDTFVQNASAQRESHCFAITRKGFRCSISPKNGDAFCWRHRGLSGAPGWGKLD